MTPAPSVRQDHGEHLPGSGVFELKVTAVTVQELVLVSGPPRCAVIWACWPAAEG